jgi:hypothetical protein
MSTYEDYTHMSEDGTVPKTDEEKLLAILNDDTSDGEFVEGAESYLNALAETGENGKEIADAVRTMLTPEEIVQQAKIAQHNAEVQKKRDERQARKKARRAAQGNRRRRR